ncbi:vitamin D 25-hydroxylase-like isoform X2 [Pomacea canaliculata]|uniref:vitamin D 25-hydroxylase-like isoform X2 n=1 Tax=Pomacea canaliculata TaxID=400727 RepID=UPI000D732617|nr:vitamin D 25-hydroxylase-like isoform X2 [Pomacea canaliculata]
MGLFQFGFLPMPALPWILAVTGLLLYFLNKVFASRKKLSVPPGPSGLRLLFDILKAVKGGTLHLLAERWARQYGEIVMCRTIIGNLCFLNSARLVRQVFTDKGTELVTNDRPKTFTATCVMYNFKDVSFSDQVTNTNWLKMRKLLHSTIKFYGSGVEKFEKVMQTELCRLTKTLQRKIKTSGGIYHGQLGEYCEVELEQIISTSIQRALAILMTGEEQSPDSKVPQMIGDLSVLLQRILSPTIESVLLTFPFLRFLPGTYYKELCGNTLKYRDMFMEEVFTKGKAKHVPGEPKGMVGSLLEAQMSNDWLIDDHIRTLLLDSIIAAFITSNELLKTIFLYMVHYPQVMKKIQQEIDSVVGHRAPSLDDRRSFHFTEAAILEVIRSTSSVPLGVWHETREDIVTDGYCIPRGTVLFENIWWMNRDPAAFEDPEVFRPERFLDDEGQLLPPTHPTRWRFLPFGIGKRSCPGENFARSRAFLYVTTLLQQFDFLPPVNHDLLPLTQDSWTEGIALQLKPCHVEIKRRSQHPQMSNSR